ncbi:MAG TPA: cardiolipin synthase [Aliicoccus persicus]|uniref:Cardiolipin synthase n=1 Tax=Aliicoccus persicus TaxID=930138 RepID=A0A921DWZ1_9STAP|nr:cardiolipin synthase [Aliicoccus persicus]
MINQLTDFIGEQITPFNIFVATLLFVNILFGISMIFIERRSAQSVWAWLLVLFFLPGLGFILYLVFGRHIYNEDLFKADETVQRNLEERVQQQMQKLRNREFILENPIYQKYYKLVHLLLYSNHAYVTVNNEITTYTDGNVKFDALLEDIKNAKHHIHFQYYIFKLDGLGKKLYNAMIEKQKEGVEVRILYDDIGSRSLNMRNFRKLKKAGGHVYAFFPNKLPLINFRLNNRNHRKIVVIDGEIGYTGGFNVGDEYVGRSEKFGYWRDTHLRVKGDAVKALQRRFMMDWNSQEKREPLKYQDEFFPNVDYKGNVPMQIGSSGPTEHFQQIKFSYIKMIATAQHSIHIQSPYFIPDQSFSEALKMAILSGIEVKIMIPSFPDHPFVYWGTYANAGFFAELGAKVYVYKKGFLHQKVLIVDDEVVSVGTTNIDNRSFALNFEINTFIYSIDEAVKHRKIFEQDIEDSELLTSEIYNERGKMIRFKEAIANLIAPIL